MIKVWPCHPRPFYDELLSSWLMRVARAHGEKLHCILSIGLNKRKNMSLRSLDSSLPFDELIKLSVPLNISHDDLYRMTLQSYAGIIFEKETRRSKSKTGVLSLGDVRSPHFYQQYCPVCLQVTEPYYRKSWRLSSITVCPHHKCRLLDRCQICGSPIYFIGNDIKDVNRPYYGEFTICHVCGSDLKNATIIEADSSVVSETIWYYHVMNAGFVRLYNDGRWTYSFVFFSLLRLMMGLASIHLTHKSKPQFKNPDLYGVEMRHEAIRFLSGCFYDWPDRFLDLCHFLGINYYQLETIQKTLGCIPYLIESDLKKHMFSPKYAPPEESIATAIRVMRSQNLRVNQTTLSKFMGYEISTVIINYLKKNNIS